MCCVHSKTPHTVTKKIKMPMHEKNDKHILFKKKKQKTTVNCLLLKNQTTQISKFRMQKLKTQTKTQKTSKRKQKA
jgi:hypothetical protein